MKHWNYPEFSEMHDRRSYDKERFLACENMMENDALSEDEESAKTENLNIL